MKIGIMQPYLFPYIGYFQLINAVDKFVIYDDVQFIKRGWINRNKILMNNTDHLFTFSVKKDHQYLNINERYFSNNFHKEKENFLKMLEMSYGKAANYPEVLALVREALDVDTVNQDVSRVIAKGIHLICEYLGLDTEILFSSEVEKEQNLKGQEHILEINKRLGSTHYINPIGGKDLYSDETFKEHGLKLNFLEPKPIEYKQKKGEFVPGLSMIDVLMFNSKDQVNQFLDEYELV